MTTTLYILTALFMMNANYIDPAIDFGTAASRVNNWLVISDNVMGGITQSKLEYTETSLVLTGTISLANYGGFSSVKTRFKNIDLSEYKGLKIRYRSANQRFAFTLEDSRNWTQPNFKGDLPPTKDNAWSESTIYFKDFKEYQIGEPTGEKLYATSLKNIVRLGIITTEKKEGPFSLEVDYVEFIK